MFSCQMMNCFAKSELSLISPSENLFRISFPDIGAASRLPEKLFYKHEWAYCRELRVWSVCCGAKMNARASPSGHFSFRVSINDTSPMKDSLSINDDPHSTHAYTCTLLRLKINTLREQSYGASYFFQIYHTYTVYHYVY